jgi:hypothetical protein
MLTESLPHKTVRYSPTKGLKNTNGLTVANFEPLT